MGFKSTIVAALLLAGLGTYIYFYEREPVKSPDDEEREKIFSVEDAKIQTIEIVKPDADPLKLVRESGSWRLTSPLEASADGTEVDSLARSLASLERERVVAEAGANLADFGLDPPRLEVRFTVEGQNDPLGLLLGSKSPTGSNLYAKSPSQDKVFLIAAYLESSFDKKPWDFRDKAIFRFNRDEVEKVILKQPEGEVVLAKVSEDLWNVTTPSFCRADRYKASGVVSRFETGRIEEIVSESPPTPAQLKEYGLASPQYEVELQLKGGRARKLLVGKEKDGRFYARNPARPLVYFIASSLVDDIKKPSADYRSKRLFDYYTYQAAKVEIAAAGAATRVLEKTKKDDQDQWTQTAPEKKELDRTTVEDLLYKLNGSDAEDFAADRAENLKTYGLETPAYTITVWSNEAKNVEELTVGKPGGEWVYARRKGDEPVLKLKQSTWEEIEKLMALEPKKDEKKEEEKEEGK
jgi:hypothetical protein